MLYNKWLAENPTIKTVVLKKNEFEFQQGIFKKKL